MENSQTLATESFSYSRSTTSRRPHSCDSNTIEKQQSFHFDVPLTASSLSIVHADEIFSDGHIMPLYAGALKDSTSAPPSPVLSNPLVTQFVANKDEPILFGKWRKSLKKILHRCFAFAKPLRCSRKNIRVNDLERKVSEFESWQEVSPRPSSACSVVDWCDVKKINNKVDPFYGLKRVKSWSGSRQAASSPSQSRSIINTYCDVESSLHEAILYCKRSIEK